MENILFCRGIVMREMLKVIEEEINDLRVLMYEVSKRNEDLTRPEVVRISQELDGKITTYQKLLYNK